MLGRGESMKDTNLSPGDLYDYKPPIYCRNCKNCDPVNNDCLAMELEEDIKPDKAMEFCHEYEEGESNVDDCVIRYLENYSIIDEKIKARCIEAIKAQRHSKVELYEGNHYCECGCPVEYWLSPQTYEVVGKQCFCSDCGAKLDWEGVEITVN